MRKDSVFINDGTPGGTVKLESQVVGNSNYELSKITNTYNGNTVVKATNKVTGEIHSFKNFGNTQAGNSLSITNTNTFLVPFNPNVSTGVTVTTSSSVRTAIGSVGANLITSVKSVTTPEVPKNPEVKPFIKPEQNIETVKKPAVTSENPEIENGSLSRQNKVVNTIRVGRWMSKDELEKMVKTGRAQTSAGGITHVTNPSNPDAFKAAKKGSIFVEFDINMDSVKSGGNEKWGIISGSGSPLDKLNRKKGLEGIKEMPEVYNIEIKGEK